MQVGKKIWGSNYQQKKLFYKPGMYAQKLNRAASDQFFNTQKAAISNLFSVSAAQSYSSLELTIRGIGQKAIEESKAMQANATDLKSQLDISV